MYGNKYLPEGSLIGDCENREFVSTYAGLERAMENGKILEGIVRMCDCDMNLVVDLGEIGGIIPRSEAVLTSDGGDIKDIAVITRVGKPVCFKVIGFDIREGRRIAVLSRRAAQTDCLNNCLMDLCVGDVIPARITHMEHFGAFADIGCGIVSLMTIDSVSVSRISHPSDRFFVGQKIFSVVKSIDYKTGRICISHKELLGTWEENAKKFSIGQTVAGIVRSVESYGIFVELTPNLAGLAEYRDDVAVGQSAAVYIKNIIPEKMKIKLVIVDACPAEPTLPKLEYMVDTDAVRHIDFWRYSPTDSDKVIESAFC
ncbi:MAG: S1 RNA-binding domain-containing protein [Clostridia bacterium]|nr:S1 RNA-binding domain-containing protein [Clostridia bacterium]